MADERNFERPAGGANRSQERMLEPGQTYFDLDNPERGPFVADGDEEIGPGANIVAQRDVSAEAWHQLVTHGWGRSRAGEGNEAYDQGAFGQEESERSDVMNAKPPGVGEDLIPIEDREEQSRS